MRNNERGFSVTEMLIALLIFSVGLMGLLKCHNSLSLSFHQQWQQREAWRVASQKLWGENTPGWDTKRVSKSNIEGCVLWQSTAVGSLKRQASLELLDCENTH